MSEKFKIETVKWEWAAAVQSKNVYRDDEFVRAASAEESLEVVDFLMSQPKGLTYTITVRRSGASESEYFTYFRHSMPCLGGLVKYRDSHGEKYFMNPYFPRDIRVAFPEGEIIFIGCHRPKILTDLKNEYYDFIFSPESPWVSAFGDKKTIIFKENYFVLTNMETDPTVFYSLMRLGGLMGGYGGTIKPDWHPKANILFGKSAMADPRRLAGQKPFRISGGSWKENFGYTRPFNESIFKTSLPKKLKDFGGLAGYPQAPHSDQYFVETMKNKFGVDVRNLNNLAAKVKPDPKIHDALVESWDYFKQEAAPLEE